MMIIGTIITILLGSVIACVGYIAMHDSSDDSTMAVSWLDGAGHVLLGSVTNDFSTVYLSFTFLISIIMGEKGKHAQLI